MGKLIKYEIKGNYRFILGVLALIIILTSAIYLYVDSAMNTDGSIIGAMFMGVSFMIIFGTLIGTFFNIVNSFKKELEEDRGYLTFTLPLSGREIVGAKLITAVFWFIVLGLVISLVNFLGLRFIIPADAWENVPSLFEFISMGLGENKLVASIALLISFLSAMVSPLLRIYFSMSLSRVTIGNRRFIKSWFIIFMILSLLLSIGQVGFTKLVPYYFSPGSLTIYDTDTVMNGLIGTEVPLSGTALSITTSSSLLIFNLGSVLFGLITLILMFLGTSYLIEKKIDL